VTVLINIVTVTGEKNFYEWRSTLPGIERAPEFTADEAVEMREHGFSGENATDSTRLQSGRAATWGNRG
jgi:hypothetical protein